MSTVKTNEPCMSLVSNHTKVEKTISVQELYELVKGDTYRPTVDAIKALYLTSKNEQADGLKKSLPAVTPSGTFNEHRKTEKLNTYSGFICLDIDDLDPKELARMKAVAMELPYTVMAFTSPSGLGLKVIVMVNSESEYHKKAYKQVQAYYEHELDCVCDKTNDVARLCYISHDPDAYLTDEADVFVVSTESTSIATDQSIAINSSPVDEYKSWFDYAVWYTGKKAQFVTSNRNNYLYLLACNCNRYKIPMSAALEQIMERYQQDDFGEDEITQTVNSAYSKHPHEFGIWYDPNKLNPRTSKHYKPTTVNYEQPVDRYLPTIPIEVVNGLPSVLGIKHEGLTDRERDIIIISKLTLLSHMLSDVAGEYCGTVVHPNLYSMVIAPPANGKSLMPRIKSAFSNYINNGNIPSNTTTTVLVDILKSTNGVGCLCESEGDAISYMAAKETDRFEYILNNSFHHEPISTARKSVEETIEIMNPRLSILLGVLPCNLPDIIQTTESGIFSRFIYYAVENNKEWTDVSQGRNLNIKAIAAELYEINEYLASLSHEIEVSLTDKQWALLNDRYTKLLIENGEISENLLAVVKRMGLITFKISMILTVLNYFSCGVLEESMVCTDEVFEVAIQLTEVLLLHSQSVYLSLNNENHKVVEMNETRLYDVLPDKFDRKRAIDKARDNGFRVSDRTIDNYLVKLTTKRLLVKDSHNNYEKANQKTVALNTSGRHKQAS